MARLYRVIKWDVLDLSVVIPAYNEAARLPRTLEATCAFLAVRPGSSEVIVVDDGSSDETAAVAASYPGVQVVRYEPNAGKGRAVRVGVLRAQGERILVMDADLATPLEELDHLAGGLDAGAQVAIGSRPLKDSQLLVRQPWYREAAGRLFNKVVQALAIPGIQDTQCGFKLFTRTAAQQIFTRCTLDGFSYDVETLFLARRLELKIAEVPVRWAHQEGAAAFSTGGRYLRAGLRMVRDLVGIRWMHRAVRPQSAASAAVGRP